MKQLDLRFPIGLMFALFGLVLVVYSLAHPALRAPLTPVNINLYAGLGMLAFGISMLLLAAKASR